MARVVKFDVSGISYQTQISTIAQYPDSMLATMINQTAEEESIQRDQEIFIDRDGHLFEYVLEFLQNGDRMVLPKDQTILSELLLEAEFFQLDGLKVLVEKKISDLLLEYKPGDLISVDDLMDPSNELQDLWKYDRMGNLIGTVVGVTGRGKVVVKFSAVLREGFREVSATFEIPLTKLKPKILQ